MSAAVRRSLDVRLGSWPASIVLAAMAFTLFLTLPQHTLHGVDGDQFVAWLEQGRLDYPRHFAYLHLAGLVFDVVRPLGVDAFRALLLTSALGSALAVLCLHRAFLLLLARTTGVGIAPTFAALATAPCFFYATCAEIHGVFAAGAAASWWAFARFLRRPTAVRAAGVGLACGAAATIHAFGHLLLPTFAIGAWTLGAVPRGRRLALLGAAAVPLVLVAAVVALGCGIGAGGQALDALGYVGRQWRDFAPATAPDVLVREWLVPYAPWSVLALLALWHPRARPWARLTLAGLLLHLPMTTLLLGFHHIDEGGAYHLPLAVPAIVAAQQLLPGPWFWTAACASALLAVESAMPEWPHPTDPAFVQGVAELHAERPMVLIVGRQELEGARIGVPGVTAIDLAAALELYAEEKEQGTDLAHWFDHWYGEFDRMGLPLLLSARVAAWFASTPDVEVRAFWDVHLPRHYIAVPAARAGFTGVWIAAQSAR